MTRFDKRIYSYILKAFEIFGWNEDEKEKRLEAFEKEVMVRFINGSIKKIPEKEREEIMRLANESPKEGSQGLHRKLTEWLNEEEGLKLFIKVADELTAEMVKNMDKKATEEQKKRLRQLFKPEVFS